MLRRKRTDGEEQPYWPLGPFKVRLPFLHYRLEYPEFIQGLVMFVAGLSMIPVLESSLGVPFDVALAFVCVFNLVQLLNIMLGVAMMPGFITAALPIVIVFLGDFEPGPEAIRALIALQLLVFVLLLVLGITGLGDTLVRVLPPSIKAGILVGAGLTAVLGELGEGGRVMEAPYSILAGSLLALVFLFSLWFRRLAQENRIARLISNYGLIPPMLIAIVIAWALNEYPRPQIEWGITAPNFGDLWNYLPFTVGLPPANVFLLAIPTAVIAYIIAFGDMVVGNEVTKSAAAVRNDEIIDTSITRLHTVTALRNFLHVLFAPYPGLAGPVWTAGHATVVERYKQGRTAMDSLYGGIGSFLIAVVIALFILPLVTIFQPVLPIALALTLILTGYVTVTVGLQQISTPIQQGVAGLTAMVLATQGALFGIVAGIVLHILLERTRLFERAQATKSSEAVQRHSDDTRAP